MVTGEVQTSLQNPAYKPTSDRFWSGRWQRQNPLMVRRKLAA